MTLIVPRPLVQLTTSLRKQLLGSDPDPSNKIFIIQSSVFEISQHVMNKPFPNRFLTIVQPSDFLLIINKVDYNSRNTLNGCDTYRSLANCLIIKTNKIICLHILSSLCFKFRYFHIWINRNSTTIECYTKSLKRRTRAPGTNKRKN